MSFGTHSYPRRIKIPILVTVLCEACGNTYLYKHTLAVYPSAFSSTGEQILARQVEKIQAGNCKAVAEHQPCPKCGYVQSWMEQAVRQQRGLLWGVGAGLGSFLLLCPFQCLLTPFLPSFELKCALMLLPYLLPVVLFFVGRAVGMARYQPNKDRDIPAQRGKPSISFAR